MSGKKHSKETLAKMRLAHRGQVSPMKGKKHSEESKRKNSDSLKGNQNAKGHKLSEEQKKSVSKAHKGKKWSLARKLKLSKSISGDKSHFWKGGKSFEHYSTDWNGMLKTLIRRRDSFTCQVCGSNGFHVHHIDYNKKNCKPDNLITLCKSCHSKTNFNRDYWQKFFNEKDLSKKTRNKS